MKAARQAGPHAGTDEKRRDGTNNSAHATYAKKVAENNESFGQARIIDGQAWLKLHAHIFDSESGIVGLTDSGKSPFLNPVPLHSLVRDRTWETRRI